MLCILILIKRGELDEWTVRHDRCPLVETDDQSVNGKEKVVVRLLQSLGDGVKLSLVAAPRDVLHLVVDDDWCDVMLFLEDFGCLGGEGSRGVGTRDGDNGCWWNK